MKRTISNFLIMIFIMSSFEAFAKKATTIVSQDDDGNEVTRYKCTSHDQCTEANEGCYDADSDEFEGADWWTKMWRRENGKNCTKDKQCDSGNCDDFNEAGEKDDKGNIKWNVVQRCGPLQVCKEAEYGDSINGVAAECIDGLEPDLQGVCISADMFDLDDSLNGEGATQPGIDMASCSVQIPKSYTLSYRYNTIMIQLLAFVFGDVSELDCIGVTPGIQNIARNIEAAQVAYGNSVVNGLKQQEAYYNTHVKDASDPTKKESIDAYNASLEVMKMNQESYIASNEILKKAYDNALLDLGTLQGFYSNYDWKHDAHGKQAPQNNSAAYTLSSGFSWNIGDSLEKRKNYCRSKSPKLKRGFKRRYRVIDGTHNGLAQYLNLNYSNLAADRKKKSGNNKQHSNEKAYFLIDPPLRNITIDVQTAKTEFKTFGTSASTRETKDDGESRARISKDLIEYMLDVYLTEMYKTFKDRPEFLAVATSGSSAGSTGAAVNLIGVTADDKTKVDAFYGDLLAFLQKHGNNKDYWDQDHKDEGKDWKNSRSKDDPFVQYFHVTHNNHVERDTASYFFANPKKKKMDPQLAALLDKTLTMGLSAGGTKAVLKFHLLMHDLRQRFYQVIFLYSAGRKKTYPNQMRNIFWGIFQSAFNSNIKYLTDLNEMGHNKSKECLVKLKAKWEKATEQEDDISMIAGDYGKLPKDKKTTEGKTTNYKKDCGGKPCSSGIGGASLATPAFTGRGIGDGQGGSGAGGNFAGGNVAAGSVGQNAIASMRKKKEAEFAKKATPAMKKAREANNKFIKMSLTPPLAAGGGEAAAAGGSSSAPSGDSATASTMEKEPEAAIVAVNEPAGGAPPSAMSSISLDDAKEMNNPDITPEHAEVLLNEAKDDKYKSDESDGLFEKITKTYMRAGLPRLLTKKVELKVDQDKEAFDPSVKKKKVE